jgi:hypothetical protein
MDSVNRPWGQWSAIVAAAAQLVPVEVVDVERGQLVDCQVAQVRLEVVLDDAARLAQGRRRPGRRRVGQPAVE